MSDRNNQTSYRPVATAGPSAAGSYTVLNTGIVLRVLAPSSINVRFGGTANPATTDMQMAGGVPEYFTAAKGDVFWYSGACNIAEMSQ